MLEGVIENDRWRAKVSVFDAMRALVNSAEEAVATELATILLAVTDLPQLCMTKVSTAAV
jgi:hypothetical protein